MCTDGVSLCVWCVCVFSSEVRQKPVYTPLLTWPVAQAKMPWGIIILLGGGFALAKGCKVRITDITTVNCFYLILAVSFARTHSEACPL